MNTQNTQQQEDEFQLQPTQPPMNLDKPWLVILMSEVHENSHVKCFATANEAKAYAVARAEKTLDEYWVTKRAYRTTAVRKIEIGK